MAQEMLNTFEFQLQRVSLIPGPSGDFTVKLNGEVIFDRRSARRFPESKELKQLIRDVIAPDQDLGHSDKKS